VDDKWRLRPPPPISAEQRDRMLHRCIANRPSLLGYLVALKLAGVSFELVRYCQRVKRACLEEKCQLTQFMVAASFQLLVAGFISIFRSVTLDSRSRSGRF
jgi:hypothetical protein